MFSFLWPADKTTEGTVDIREPEEAKNDSWVVVEYEVDDTASTVTTNIGDEINDVHNHSPDHDKALIARAATAEAIIAYSEQHGIEQKACHEEQQAKQLDTKKYERKALKGVSRLHRRNVHQRIIPRTKM